MSLGGGSVYTGSYYGGGSYSSTGSSAYSSRFTSSRSNTLGRQFGSTDASGFEKIVKYVVNGQADEVVAKWDELEADLLSMAAEYGYEDLTEDQIDTMMNKALRQSTNYSDVDDVIDANVNGSLVTGFFEGLDPTGLFTDKNSAAELKAKINGDKVKASEYVKEGIGAAAGGAISGAAIGAGVGAVVGPIGVVAGAAGGAIVGAVWGIGKMIFNNFAS